MAVKIAITNGAFQDFEGNVLANGYLLMQVSQDEQAPGAGQICAGFVIKVPLDANGNVNGVVNVWPNDVLVPANSFYKVTGYDKNGVLAWGPNNQQITGAGPFSLSTWVPNQLLVWTPLLPIAVSSSAPATASSVGTPGLLAYDSGFLYVCVASNTWKRVAISTF